MIPEVKSIEAQLKQILYGCVEHVQATKAALFLSATRDLNDKSYELVTSYQYKVADRNVVNANDDLVDRLAVKRSAFFVNGLSADPRLAEMMFRQGNDRLLAVPLFSRGRLVGFIDMRDKAGKKPFAADDAIAATKIADQVSALLASKGLFGLAPVSLVEDPQRLAGQAAPAAPSLPRQEPAPQPAVPLQAGQVFSAEASRAIEAARQYMTRRQMVQQQNGRRGAGEGDYDVLRVLLPSALAIPGAVAACFSTIGNTNNPQSVVASAPIAEDALELLHNHLQTWLKRTNQPHMTVRTQPLFPFGAQAYPIQGGAITAVLSTPISPQSVEGLVLTVMFERTLEAQAQRFVQNFIKQMEPTIESALASSAGRVDRWTLAERLLEPDFSKLPDLADHCREVSVISQRFARVLELPAGQAETLRIAALVHDVGMRLLDYDRLSKRANLTPEEMRGIAEHPVVGAALVEPLLGTEVAHAVLRHHERVDGKGYPSRLAGNQIPLASRIIAIADAWVAMTAVSSYKPPIAREEAVQKLRESAGSQFDPALVERFLAALPELI